MSQRIENVNANFVNTEADPAQTVGRISVANGASTASQGGIEGIVPDINPSNPGTIQLRVGSNGPSGLNKEQAFLPIAATPSVTVT